MMTCLFRHVARCSCRMLLVNSMVNSSQLCCAAQGGWFQVCRKPQSLWFWCAVLVNSTLVKALGVPVTLKSQTEAAWVAMCTALNVMLSRTFRVDWDCACTSGIAQVFLSKLGPSWQHDVLHGWPNILRFNLDCLAMPVAQRDCI